MIRKLSCDSGGYRGVTMVSAETPSENTHMCMPHPINKWKGGRLFFRNGSREGFHKVAEC